jgi:hypothetical protein
MGWDGLGCMAQVPTGRYAYMISTAAHLVGLLLNSLLLGIVVAKGESYRSSACSYFPMISLNAVSVHGAHNLRVKTLCSPWMAGSGAIVNVLSNLGMKGNHDNTHPVTDTTPFFLLCVCSAEYCS